MSSIVERLRATHIRTYGSGIPELCEEAARTIEHLKNEVITYQQAATYLSGAAVTSNWENDI